MIGEFLIPRIAPTWTLTSLRSQLGLPLLMTILIPFARCRAVPIDLGAKLGLLVLSRTQFYLDIHSGDHASTSGVLDGSVTKSHQFGRLIG